MINTLKLQVGDIVVGGLSDVVTVVEVTKGDVKLLDEFGVVTSDVLKDIVAVLVGVTTVDVVCTSELCDKSVVDSVRSVSC